MYGKLHFLLVVVGAIVVILSLVEGKPASSTSENPTVVCRLPAVRGHCRALLPRWRYDPSTGKCHEFKFGGCDGNGNNFQSQKACMAICKGV